MKSQRIVDEELLETVRGLACMCCQAPPRSHPHHLRSRGAGGDDVAENVVALCFDHHREIHQRGIDAMATRYPLFRTWLELAGWEKDPVLLKWRIK